MRIRVIWIGRTKDEATRLWTAEYVRRIGRFARITTDELSEKQGEAGLLQRCADLRLVLMEPGGKSLDSTQFSAYLAKLFEREGREVAFAIGGAEGFTAAARAQASARLSLSPLTFSHELARVVLLEQLYRACTILNHHPYAR
ncbi:MAG: 23S rRNA (pseudouridine(1915)-N(3))-methyltransferase RlmH [Terriglobales bacterium]